MSLCPHGALTEALCNVCNPIISEQPMMPKPSNAKVIAEIVAEQHRMEMTVKDIVEKFAAANNITIQVLAKPDELNSSIYKVQTHIVKLG